MRHAMGVAVFFGMLGVTFFGLLLTPVFYVALRSLSGGKALGHGGAPISQATEPKAPAAHEDVVSSILIKVPDRVI
jgi:hypothetical protein